MRRYALYGVLIAATAALPAAAQQRPAMEAEAGSGPEALDTGAYNDALKESAADVEAKRRGTWTFVLENDLFAGTDRNYTNGVQLSYTSAADRAPKFMRDFGSWLQAGRQPEMFGTFALTQRMLTPQDIEAVEPLPDQHPYAGHLAGTAVVTAIAADRLDALTLSLGVVGPAALGAEAQRLVHEIIDGRDPKGWANQLRNEPALLIGYERRYRGWIDFDFIGLEGDLVPGGGVALGNVQTSASINMAVRLGTGLGNDFGPARIQPSLATSHAIRDGGFAFYAFASAEGRAIARSIFLDGNSFRDGPSVERIPLVAEFQLGMELAYRRIRAGYTFVVRTPTYDTEIGRQKFAALSLSVQF